MVAQVEMLVMYLQNQTMLVLLRDNLFYNSGTLISKTLLLKNLSMTVNLIWISLLSSALSVSQYKKHMGTLE